MSELISFTSLIIKLNKLRQAKQQIVLITGCFDILHTEHIKFIKSAKTRGDVLVLGLETDLRVNQLKGKGRPINRLKKRAYELKKTNVPDYIFALPENFNTKFDHTALIAKIRPNILAVSSHTLHLDKKKEIVSHYGGELRVVLPHNPQFSSSKLLQDLFPME